MSAGRALNASRRGRLLLIAGAGLGLALAALGTFAPEQAGRAPGPAEAARVNTAAITLAELERALARIEADTQGPVSDERRVRVLERLIDEELLVQRGVALGLVEADAPVRKALASAVIASVLAEAASARPSDAALEAFFAANRAYFTAPVRVRVVRILVRDGATADARVAAALAALDDAGLAPAEVSRRFGDATPLELPDGLLPEAKLRELLGPTEAEIALALEPGAHSGAVASEGGRSILVSLERARESSPDLEAVRPQVEAEWSRRAGERALAEYVATLRREAEIRIANDSRVAE